MWFGHNVQLHKPVRLNINWNYRTITYTDAQVKVCSRETHTPRRASKIYKHNAF